MQVVNTSDKLIVWQEFHFNPGVPVEMGGMRWEIKLAQELISRIPALEEYSQEKTTKQKRIEALKKARAAKAAKRKAK